MRTLHFYVYLLVTMVVLEVMLFSPLSRLFLTNRSKVDVCCCAAENVRPLSADSTYRSKSPNLMPVKAGFASDAEGGAPNLMPDAVVFVSADVDVLKPLKPPGLVKPKQAAGINS